MWSSASRVNKGVKGGYISYHSLSVILEQFGHFLLTSRINKAYWPTELPTLTLSVFVK